MALVVATRRAITAARSHAEAPLDMVNTALVRGGSRIRPRGGGVRIHGCVGRGGSEATGPEPRVQSRRGEPDH